MADTAPSTTDIAQSRKECAVWKTAIDQAEGAKEFKKWVKRGEKIVKRYRDERVEDTDVYKKGRRFNILWSNVQTLIPAVYAKAPEAIVERRYLDKDPLGRVAATMLERSLRYEVECGYLNDSVRRAVLDFLLPGRGQVWVRYEPKFGEAISPKQEGGSPYETDGGPTDVSPSQDGSSERVAGGGTYGGDEGTQGELLSEKVCWDYVHWQDYLTSPGRTEAELTWKARRLFLGREELKERFKDGAKIPLEKPRDAMGRFVTGDDNVGSLKATVYEIWCDESKEVIFICKEWDQILDKRADPLKLDGFYPCPCPLNATMTNDSPFPVADYVEYQDQADQLDNLTGRIDALTRSLKVAGCYDASVGALKRLLDESMENQLVPVQDWARFAEKGGLDGAVSWLPIKDIAATLLELTQIREQIKADLYEITGMSDIIRGNSDPRETATAQQIKGSYASQRLAARQGEVARFCRDLIGIGGEIIAEHFSPETLIASSAVLQDDGLTADALGGPPAAGPESAPQGMVPPPGGAPGSNVVPMQPGMAIPPPVDPQQEKLKMIAAAIALLRQDKLRGFRLDIETDSTIMADALQTKQERTELITAMGGFLDKAVIAGAQFPQMIPLLGKSMLWVLRGYRVGRDLEASFEEFIDSSMEQAKEQAANPQPDPAQEMEKQKAQAEIVKAQIAAQQAQMQAQHDAQMKALELQIAQVKASIEERKLGLDEQYAQAEHSRKMQQMAVDAMVSAEQTDAQVTVAREKAKAAKVGGGAAK